MYERFFCNLIKSNVLPRTRFKFLGEELIFKFPIRGQSDLLLRHPNYFLALELKVGNPNQFQKQRKLVSQVEKYTKAFQHHFPDFHVLGLGAYWSLPNDVMFFHHENRSETDINWFKFVIKDEIKKLEPGSIPKPFC